MPRCSFFISAAILLASAVAHADSYTVFNFSSTLASGSASGTLTLDDTTSQFTSSTVTVTQNGTQYSIPLPGPTFSEAANTTSLFVGDEVGQLDGLGLELTLPVSTLLGYTGGHVQADFTTDYGNTYDHGSGSLTLAPASVTPEPSSLALLGTGMLGLSGVVRRRFA